MSTRSHLVAVERDPSSFVLRRVLPVMALVTVGTGWLRWLATDRGLVSDNVGVVLMTAFAVAVFTGFSFWTARALRLATATQRSADRDRLYRLIASNIPGGAVLLFDRELRYMLAEGQNLREVGLDRSDLEGRTIWEALEPHAAAALEPSYRAALTGESTVFEMEFRDKVYLVAVAPTFDDTGEIVGGIVQSQQITEQKQLEEQLLQSQKLEAVGALAGGVAHDFNNLLTVISGYASLSLSGMPHDDAGREGIEQIDLAAKRAAALTQQLLAFSRKQLLQPQPLDVNEVVNGLVPMLTPIVEARIEIVLALRAGLSSVMFDRGRLEQVIVNLVVNARDAISDTGTITIETAATVLDDEYAARHTEAKAGPHVMLAITDTGAGFDEQTHKRIFEPFFTTKPVGSGTGLGLSTVHGIVKQSGGNIWVYSEPGRGTIFKIYLPVTDEVVARPSIEWSGGAADSGERRHHPGGR